MSILRLFNGRIVDVTSDQAGIALDFGTRVINLVPNAVTPTGDVASANIGHNDLFILTGTQGSIINLPVGLQGFVINISNKSTTTGLPGSGHWTVVPAVGELIEGPTGIPGTTPSTNIDPLVIDDNDAAFTLVYTNAANGWQILTKP